MRFFIETLNENKKWIKNSVILNGFLTESEDLSKIMNSIVEICRSKPNIVVRNSLRLFDGLIFDWVLRAEIEQDFIPYKDSIYILWNYNLSKDHPALEFKIKKNK